VAVAMNRFNSNPAAVAKAAKGATDASDAQAGPARDGAAS
jgi:hypothetical protein